jgi:hypothetical protein
LPLTISRGLCSRMCTPVSGESRSLNLHCNKSNETLTWCDTVQVLFLQSHSTCFGRKRPSTGVFKTSTAATGTCVIVVGQSSHLLIRAFQMKHQLDAKLCRFYFSRVTLHVSGASTHQQEYLKLVQLPLVHVLSLQVSHHISLLGPSKWNTNLMQHCAGFISAGSLYMFRAHAPIIRSI